MYIRMHNFVGSKYSFIAHEILHIPHLARTRVKWILYLVSAEDSFVSVTANQVKELSHLKAGVECHRTDSGTDRPWPRYARMEVPSVAAP